MSRIESPCVIKQSALVHIMRAINRLHLWLLQWSKYGTCVDYADSVGVEQCVMKYTVHMCKGVV